MSETSETSETSVPAAKEMVLRDLEPLLRQKLGEGLILESFSASNLLPPGENYGSSILSVEAVIRREKRASAREVLRLIAKMPPPTDFQRKVFDSPYTFRKEIFMYEEILPSYNRLEIECGIEPKEVFHVLAEFYGSRLSLDPSVPFDDDAVILIENLKARNYYNGSRQTGYDLEHSRMVLRAAARFHALGIAMKYKKPDYFEILKERSKCLKIENTESFENVTRTMLNKIKEDEVMAPYYTRCERAISLPTSTDWSTPPTEPWSTIIHSDFWVNNIMLHRDAHGRVDDVKFVDFQNYLFLSPLRDLVFYLFSSTDQDVRERHIDQLIDLYYETFASVLKRMKCDVGELSRDSFHRQLPVDAQIEFAHLSFMLKVMTLDAQAINFNHDQMEDMMTQYHGNTDYHRRLRELVVEFGRRKWI